STEAVPLRSMPARAGPGAASWLLRLDRDPLDPIGGADLGVGHADQDVAAARALEPAVGVAAVAMQQPQPDPAVVAAGEQLELALALERLGHHAPRQRAGRDQRLVAAAQHQVRELHGAVAQPG